MAEDDCLIPLMSAPSAIRKENDLRNGRIGVNQTKRAAVAATLVIATLGSLPGNATSVKFGNMGQTPTLTEDKQVDWSAKNRAALELAMNDDERKQAVIKEVQTHPEYFSEETKKNVLNGKIIIGMSPYEAQLAGGAFFYQVEADKRWPKNADPLAVINRQTNDPDDSKITLTFNNTTQFDSREPKTFRVEFVRGRVMKIVPLE